MQRAVAVDPPGLVMRLKVDIHDGSKVGTRERSGRHQNARRFGLLKSPRSGSSDATAAARNHRNTQRFLHSTLAPAALTISADIAVSLCRNLAKSAEVPGRSSFPSSPSALMTSGSRSVEAKA